MGRKGAISPPVTACHRCSCGRGRERGFRRAIGPTVCPKLKVKLVSKLADLMDDAEADVLAYMGFPAQHRAKIHSTNPLERLNSLPRT